MNSRRVIMTAVFAVLAVISLAAARPSRAAVSCAQVDAVLAPCVRYLIGHGGGGPSPACCSGVKAVKEMAALSPADKRACCGCIKAAAGRYPNMNDEAAAGLPSKCGVATDIPISRAVDCERIN